jgi:hypothetical protein
VQNDFHDSTFNEDSSKDAAESRAAPERHINSRERQNEMTPDKALSGGARCDTLGGDLADRERLIADMTRAYADLRRELEQTNARVEELAAEAATARIFKERLELIESSTSWRLTAPFRALKDSLLRRKSRLAPKVHTGANAQAVTGESVGHLASAPADVPRSSPQEENDNDSSSLVRTVLVFDRFVPIMGRNSGSARLLEIIEAIGTLGQSVTFCSHAAPADYELLMGNVEEELPRYVRTLKELGATAIFGHSDIVEHMKQYGHNYQQVFLSFPEIMYEYLPVVRTYSPWAQVFYITENRHGISLEREAAITSEKDLQEPAHHCEKMERVNLRSADTVIALTENEREQILKLIPGANVVVVPNIQRNFSPQPAQKQISTLLTIVGNHDTERRDLGRR